MTGILTWLDEPSATRGVHFAGDGGEWTFWSYRQLARLSRRAAVRLRAAGVAPGDVVLLICPATAEFVGGFFGALLAGATPSVAAVPTAFRNQAEYRDHISRLLGVTRARTVVTTPDLSLALQAPVGDRGVPLISDLADESTESADSEPDPARTPAPETAVLQFSSGSSGPPRGVQISMGALNSNINAIGNWLGLDSEDSLASWLPLHHDMGLVGSLLIASTHRMELWSMRPEQFIRRPLRWIELFGSQGATSTTVPVFGLTQVLRRVRPADVAHLDLSRWRTLIVGAERIDASVLTAFADLLRPAGFRPQAILPAYGLAEATLAVTGRKRANPLRAVTVDVESLAVGKTVQWRPDGGFFAADGRSDDERATEELAPHNGQTETTVLVSCGQPLRGTEITIVDDDEHPVEDGVVGQILVRGPSCADGYVVEAGTVPIPFEGVLHTGDAGFRLHDDYFVIGRLGDSLKLFGRWVFAEEVEHIAIAHSPRPARTICLLGLLDGRETAAVVVEGVHDGEAAVIGQAVVRNGYELRTLVLNAPVGWIRRTTSGKPMRRAMWHLLMEGRGKLETRFDNGKPSADRGCPESRETSATVRADSTRP
jgi:acyl-CoA synthetase (AMP-forming)/AMP-acid ligase II